MKLAKRHLFIILVILVLAYGLIWYTSSQIILKKVYELMGEQEFKFFELREEDENYFEGFDNETGVDEFIVPNIIHYIRFNNPNFTFVDAVSVLSAFKNQRPEKITFYANDVNFVGPYWEKIKNTPGLVYEIVKVAIPERIFGQKFNEGWRLWHAADVTRIKILMEHGGIYLDNDVYVVQSLDKFRKFEMSVGWERDFCIGNQVIIAHKKARFLRLWLESYRQYHADQWYYNAGCKPVEEHILKKPELVHMVKLLFGIHILIHPVYQIYWEEWRNQYTIHLLTNHRHYLDKDNFAKYPVFNEDNIKNFNYTFGVMAREAYGIS